MPTGGRGGAHTFAHPWCSEAILAAVPNAGDEDGFGVDAIAQNVRAAAKCITRSRTFSRSSTSRPSSGCPRARRLHCRSESSVLGRARTLRFKKFAKTLKSRTAPGDQRTSSATPDTRPCWSTHLTLRAPVLSQASTSLWETYSPVSSNWRAVRSSRPWLAQPPLSSMIPTNRLPHMSSAASALQLPKAFSPLAKSWLELHCRLAFSLMHRSYNHLQPEQGREKGCSNGRNSSPQKGKNGRPARAARRH